MSDANSLPPDSDADEELKNALIAAFGVDGVDLLDDDEDDFENVSEQFPVTVDNDSHETATKSPNEATEWSDNQHDSSRNRWIKQVSTAILANDIRALSECGYGSENLANHGKRFLIFAIGTQRFGVPLRNVCEIARYPNVTELPRTAAWLRGVTNFRGQITSVTDLRILFEVTEKQPAANEKIIVVRGMQSNATTAMVVDQVLGVRDLEGQSKDTSKLAETIGAFATGSIILDQVATILVDPDQILSCADRLRSPEQHQNISTCS